MLIMGTMKIYKFDFISPTERKNDTSDESEVFKGSGKCPARC
jgi:hypothetical protein